MRKQQTKLLTPTGTLIRHLSEDEAITLLASGAASRLASGCLVLADDSQKRMCQQGVTYERAASDMHPQFFQGGLVRTETQPEIAK